MSYQLTVVLMS